MTMRTNSTIAALIVAVTGSLALAGHTSTANAKNVLSCDANGRSSLIDCCEMAVLKHGLPIWMRQARRSCTTAQIRCIGGPNTPGISSAAVMRRCWYVAEYDDANGDIRKHEPKGRDPQRGAGIN